MRTVLQRCSTSLAWAAAYRPIARSASTFLPAQRLHALKAIRTLHSSTSRRQQEWEAYDEREDDSGYQPEALDQAPRKAEVITKFSQLAEQNVLHPRIVQTLTEDMGLSDMTDVQSQTINEAIKGTDIIAQARTGTGKTLAFLMPILQNIIKIDPDLARPAAGRRGPRTTADDIRAIIISPTRELAEQIGEEAKKLVRGTSVIVQTAVGGTQKSMGLRAIQNQGCHILVGTPGRLTDILTDEYSRVQAPDLSCLVLDEADRLLDQGFWPDIQNIVKILPSPQEKDRQTLMFSATVPRSVVDIVRQTLKPGFQFVQCVKADEIPTHEKVPQKIVVARGLENIIPSVIELCSREIQTANEKGDRPFKAIIYFGSTAEVSLANAALQNLSAGNTGEAQTVFSRHNSHPWKDTRVSEIHAKLTQAQRTNAANQFRTARSAILLSSDVTARGLDFPDVTHVIQVGCPNNQEQYIHRVGRTGRAGKEGEGWLIIPEFELQEARRTLGRLPIKKDNTLEIAALDLTRELQVSANAGGLLSMFQRAMGRVDATEKIKVYRALLGVYTKLPRKDELIASMNRLAQYGWGMKEVPSIPSGLASKLRLSGIPGVRIGEDPRERFNDDRRGGFGGDRRSGGFGNDRRGGSFGGDRRGGDAFGSSFGGRGGSGGFGGRQGNSRGSGGFGGRGGRSQEPSF